MSRRTWVWVGIGMLVSTMWSGGVAFAAGQRVSWPVPQVTVDGRAVELPNAKAPEASQSLQPLAVQGGDRSAIGQRQLLADGGDSPVRCSRPKCP